MILACEGASAGAGGIARVARLTAKVLRDEGIAARALVWGEQVVPGDFALPGTGFGRSKLRFAATVHREALGGEQLLYSNVGMARAHPSWPLRAPPFALWLHGIEVWEEMRQAWVRTVRRAGRLIANSSYTVERAARLRPALFDRAEVCWLATEADEAPPPAPRGDGPPTVLIVGRIEEAYKGHEELIAGWPRVTAAVPQARLVIAGTGSRLGAIRSLASASSARSRIEVVGFVPEPEIEALWRRATIFAMPSRGEGFGLVYIEAMRRGLPVVASLHDAAPEISPDGVAGYNVDLDRPNELADRLIHLLRDRDHVEMLGQAGQKRWATFFRYSAFRERFRPILRRLLAA